MLRPVLLLFVSIAAIAATAGITREVVFFGKFYGTDPIPRFDKGFLLFQQTNRRDSLSVWSPAGKPLYDVTVKGPNAMSLSITSAAVHKDGGIAVGAGWISTQGVKGGAIAMIDSSGKQVGFVDTGRYMPAHVCFDYAGSLWSLGWQRDKHGLDREESEDYLIVRKFSRDGKQSGAFIPRSLFRGKLAPATPVGGLWIMRAARDRIGALVHPNTSDHVTEWVEWDLEGSLISRWPLDGRRDWIGELAFTDGAKLYAYHNRKLALFDRSTATWQPVASPFETQDPRRDAPGFMLGADGNDLVFSLPPNGGIRLAWFSPAQ